MASISISIKKDSVYEEVAKTTAYLGAKGKLEDGKPAFDQMFVKEADKTMLERFYDEAEATLLNLLKRFVSGIATTDGTTTWTLAMPSSFDTTLAGSIGSSANSFVVNCIIGKWCEITANDKVREYADNANGLLQEIKEKVFFKSAPTRRKPS